MKLLSMSKKVQSLSPERDALALAINEMTGRARDVAKAKNVVERARDLRQQARAVFENASAAASAARDDHRAAVLHSAQTGEAVKATSVTRDLRHALDDAAETLEAADAAVETAEAALGEVQTEFDYVRKGVYAAADKVIATAAEEALARCKALEREHMNSLLTLRRIEHAMGLVNREDPLRWAMHLAASHFTFRSQEDRDAARRIDAAWDAVREDLARDATAALPSVILKGEA